MPPVRGILAFSLLLALCALLASGCGEAKRASAETAAAAKPALACPNRAAWQALANNIKAPVYCPAWLPDPLVGNPKGKWNNGNYVDKDRSYLMSFVWQETGPGIGGGELHVVLRGYPARTTIPTCRTGGADSRNVPCFDGKAGRITENGITATLYNGPNQDMDAWHALLLWRRGGNLYTLSEHVAPPLTYNHVIRYLKREMRSLVLIKPSA
jgi:hypothetical protein